MLWLLRGTAASSINWVRFMPQPKKISRVAPVETQRCPRCHAKMMLTRIMPGSPGFEIRSFECPECRHAIAQRVASQADMDDRLIHRHRV